MKPIAVVYVSETGHTEAYAKMLGAKTGMSVYTLQQAQTALAVNAPVLYMGWLMAGRVKDFSKAQRRYNLRGVCAVGLADSGALDETVRRVSYMERLMDEVMAARKDESRTWPWFRMRQLRVLEDYYENGLWRLDFETDEKGLLPRGLKRGVLSEDGLYNLLTDAWEERKAHRCQKQEKAE